RPGFVVDRGVKQRDRAYQKRDQKDWQHDQQLVPKECLQDLGRHAALLVDRAFRACWTTTSSSAMLFRWALNFRWASAWPARPTRARRSGSFTSASTACRNAAPSPAPMTTPEAPRSTASLRAPTSVVTIGRPAAVASMSTTARHSA